MPEGSKQLRMWVNAESFYPLIFVWIVLEDATGKTDTVTLGDMPDPGWRMVSADIPPDLVHPIKVVSIQINEPGFGATATAGSAVFDDLQAVSETGEITLIEGFEEAFDWVPLATSQLGSDEINQVSDSVHSGLGAAHFRFGKETNVGIRGIYRAGGYGFIPAVASRTFSAASGAGVNNSLLVNLPGGVVPVVITDTVDYFPTMDPARGGFLIFDIDTLLTYLDALNPVGATAINEIFIEAAPGADTEVLETVSKMVRARGSAIGLEDQLAAQDIDPLISAGWRTIVLVALGVILFISGLGYIVYLLAFADRSVGEMGSLRSLGIQPHPDHRPDRAGAHASRADRPRRRYLGRLPDEPHDGVIRSRNRQRRPRPPPVHPDHELDTDGPALHHPAGDLHNRPPSLRRQSPKHRPPPPLPNGELAH